MDQWVPSRATVLDPFCGSGTTLVEAKLLGRPSVGIDLNPLAVTLANAKLQAVRLEDLEYRLTTLACEFRGEAELEDIPDVLEPIFHSRTLAQLCYLKKVLTTETPEDVFLKGCILGIMHGKARRDGNTSYLSVDMPNTFSMSPRYVRRFVAKNDLSPPPVDVFSKLRERCAWLLRIGALPETPRSIVLYGDAANLDLLLHEIGIHTVGAIVTSPPYLGILRYGAYNWIRLWFLGYEQNQIDNLLDGTDSLETYLSFLASFLGAASRVLRPGGIAVLIIGDVVEHGQCLPLAERVWTEMEGLFPFELLNIELDAYDQNNKTTRIWGEERKGRASPMDRVILLRRTPKRQRKMTLRPTAAQQGDEADDPPVPPLAGGTQ